MRYTTDAVPAVRYDWATGLYSRWYVEARADEELARALREGTAVFVVRLKALTPDVTERLVAWLRTGLRATDIAGVVGPGAFAIVLTGLDRDSLGRWLYRARCVVGMPLIAAVAAFPEDGLTFDALLRHACSAEARARAA